MTTPTLENRGDLEPRFGAWRGWDGLRRLPVPTWLLGLLAAAGSWTVGFARPYFSLDPSWQAGLYMAADRGMDFGTEIVFTYGPLGFLRQPWLWYEDLAVPGFLYAGALHIALSISLVWALRRSVPGAVALILALLVLLAAPGLEVAITLTAVWCLAALSPSPPAFARPLVALGGGALGGVESLISLRSGPVILAMCGLTLLGLERRRIHLPALAGCAAVVLMCGWLAAGQRIGNLPDFARNAIQIVSGYAEAMGTEGTSPLYVPLIILLAAALVAAAAFTSASGHPRIAAAAVVGVAAFVLYKEALIRADPNHVAIFFATAAGIGTAFAFGSRAVVATVAAVGLAGLAVALPRPGHPPLDFNPVTHARHAKDQVRILVSAERRRRIQDNGRFALAVTYALAPSTRALLQGRTVHVDPWEAAVAWALRLDWDPLPVFQDYSAYTANLDRLNADELRSPDGPQRILRENTKLVDPQYPTPAIDSRLPAWDPPEAALAMHCHYKALQGTARWQVLGKVPNRCGRPRLLRTIDTRYEQTITIPPAPPRALVFARIHGAEVSGLERLGVLAYRARFRHVVVNGARWYRLVPGTAADGLIMRAAPGVDHKGPWALSPGAGTIKLTGDTGELRVELYSMRVAP